MCVCVSGSRDAEMVISSFHVCRLQEHVVPRQRRTLNIVSQVAALTLEGIYAPIYSSDYSTGGRG